MRSVKYVSALAAGFMALSGFAEPVYKSSFKNKGSMTFMIFGTEV